MEDIIFIFIMAAAVIFLVFISKLAAKYNEKKDSTIHLTDESILRKATGEEKEYFIRRYVPAGHRINKEMNEKIAENLYAADGVIEDYLLRKGRINSYSSILLTIRLKDGTIIKAQCQSSAAVHKNTPVSSLFEKQGAGYRYRKVFCPDVPGMNIS